MAGCGHVRGATVVVTGGARGIGRATAEAFLAAGARVAIGDIDAELVAKSAADLVTRPGAEVIGLPLDVTDRASFARFLDAAERELGPLNVLVNNAGIMPTGLLLDEDDAMTDRMVDINLRGVITGSKLAGVRFVERGQGHVVNVASLAGTFGAPALATYCGTKFAVVGFSEAFGHEVKAAGVGVTAVLPGVVRTELSAGATYAKWAAPFVAVEPEDVAAAVVAAVGGKQSRVSVPKALYTVVRLAALIPPRVRARMERRAGVNTAFTQADPVAREAYHRRIGGSGS